MKSRREVIAGLLVFDHFPTFFDVAGEITVSVVDVFEGVAHFTIILSTLRRRIQQPQSK